MTSKKWHEKLPAIVSAQWLSWDQVFPASLREQDSLVCTCKPLSHTCSFQVFVLQMNTESINFILGSKNVPENSHEFLQTIKLH